MRLLARPSIHASAVVQVLLTLQGSSVVFAQPAELPLEDLRIDVMEEAQRLRLADSATELQQHCSARPTQKAYTDREEFLIWQDLCQGWVGVLKQDWRRAEKSFRATIAKVAALPSSQRHQARHYWLEATFAIGGIYETRLRTYELCLAELGHGPRARMEAERRAFLQKTAEDAYREIITSGPEEWRVRCLHRIASMSDFFYRDLADPSRGLRALELPPPLPSVRLEQLPVSTAHINVEYSRLRRLVMVSYDRIILRARRAGMPKSFIEEVTTAQRNLKDWTPTSPAGVLPPWPQREGEHADIHKIEKHDQGFHIQRYDGKREEWSREQAVVVLRGLLQQLDKGRWAPTAAVYLAQLGDQESLPWLEQAVTQTVDPELRVAATYALGRLGTPAQSEILLQVFRERHQAEPRELFATPSGTIFGLRERILIALSEIGRRHPQAVQNLLKESGVPVSEAAFVLWRVGSKSLHGTYLAMRDHADPVVAAYGVMALVDQQGEAVKWMLRDLPNDVSVLMCVKSHLLDTIDAND